MHEAGLVAQALGRALDQALRAAPPAAAPVHAAPPGAAPGVQAPGPKPADVTWLKLDVLDPVGLSVDATLLHLELAMAEHGLAGVPVALHVMPVRCAGCGDSSVPAPGDPFCAACGWPLPRQEGSPLRIRAMTGSGPVPRPEIDRTTGGSHARS
jgi:hypothetical protein